MLTAWCLLCVMSVRESPVALTCTHGEGPVLKLTTKYVEIFDYEQILSPSFNTKTNGTLHESRFLKDKAKSNIFKQRIF